MRIISLRQGSREWEEWRKGGLGGSDAAAVLGVSPWTTPRQLWEEMTGRAPPRIANYAMRRGQRLEGVARAIYQHRTGRVVEPACCVHGTYNWMRASLDGVDFWGERVVEIKCPNATAHRQALDGVIPAHYMPQVQHQLAVTGAQALDYVSYTEHKDFVGDDRLAIVPVTPDPEYIARLLHAEWCFWGCVLMGFWPERAPARVDHGVAV